MGPKDRLRRHPGAIRNGELGGGARNGSPRTVTRITYTCTASRSGWLRRWPEYVQKWRPGELGFAGEEARDPEAIIAQGLPRQPVFFRPPRLPQPRRPEAAAGVTPRRGNRHHPQRRRPARPRAIHLRHRPPPPPGEVLFGVGRRAAPPVFHKTGDVVDYVHVTAIPAEPANQAKIQSEPRSLTQISNLRSRNPVRYQPAAGAAPRSRSKEPMDVGPRADRAKTTLRAPADFCVP